jgi:hypothetical protein
MHGVSMGANLAIVRRVSTHKLISCETCLEDFFGFFSNRFVTSSIPSWVRLVAFLQLNVASLLTIRSHALQFTCGNTVES